VSVLYNSDMADSPAMVVSAGSTDARIEVSSDERRRRWFEVGLVLVVAFGRPILNSLYLLGNRPAVMPQISNARWILSGVEEVIGLLLLGYVLSGRGLKFRNLGLRWSMQDVGVGLVVSGFCLRGLHSGLHGRSFCLTMRCTEAGRMVRRHATSSGIRRWRFFRFHC
jgi:hypothetical protein